MPCIPISRATNVIPCWKRRSSGWACRKQYAIQATIYSEAPSGCSTGTSAAVSVALIGALDRLTPGQMTPHEVANTAHAIEVEMLKQQSGVQDQLCSAYGGINFIDVFKYPYSSVSQIHVSNATWWELERRLALIFLGKSHVSSKVHEKVIAELEDEGPDCKRLQDLRVTAEKSRDAVYAGDFPALGQAMVENTAAQGRLHPDLISQDAQQVIDIAKGYGALGWKVNGAGGEGGSVTLLCPALVVRQTRDAARHRGSESAVQEYSHLSEPSRVAHLGASVA